MQLLPLPPTISCFSEIQIGFTFLVPAHLGSPGQSAVKQMWLLSKTRVFKNEFCLIVTLYLVCYTLLYFLVLVFESWHTESKAPSIGSAVGDETRRSASADRTARRQFQAGLRGDVAVGL